MILFPEDISEKTHRLGLSPRHCSTCLDIPVSLSFCPVSSLVPSAENAMAQVEHSWQTAFVIGNCQQRATFWKALQCQNERKWACSVKKVEKYKGKKDEHNVKFWFQWRWPVHSLSLQSKGMCVWERGKGKMKEERAEIIDGGRRGQKKGWWTTFEKKIPPWPCFSCCPHCALHALFQAPRADSYVNMPVHRCTKNQCKGTWDRLKPMHFL